MTRFTRMILYVKDVKRSLDFYANGFGFKASAVDPSGGYAELATGETNLALSAEGLGHMLLLDGFRANDPAQSPAGILVGIIVDDVSAAFEQAVSAGATAVAAPHAVPWGMKLAHVRDLDGILIEIGKHITSQS